MCREINQIYVSNEKKLKTEFCACVWAAAILCKAKAKL